MIFPHPIASYLVVSVAATPSTVTLTGWHCPPRLPRLSDIGYLIVHTQSISSVCPYHAHYPPAKQSAGPYGLTTIPFCEGLYLPRIIGLSLFIRHRFTLQIQISSGGTSRHTSACSSYRLSTTQIYSRLFAALAPQSSRQTRSHLKTLRATIADWVLRCTPPRRRIERLPVCANTVP